MANMSTFSLKQCSQENNNDHSNAHTKHNDGAKNRKIFRPASSFFIERRQIPVRIIVGIFLQFHGQV
jgi:hypothetical protein